MWIAENPAFTPRGERAYLTKHRNFAYVFKSEADATGAIAVLRTHPSCLKSTYEVVPAHHALN